MGTVAELWRYPVKSMRGEIVPALPLGDGGAAGDRAWALRDLENGRIYLLSQREAGPEETRAAAGDALEGQLSTQ